MRSVVLDIKNEQAAVLDDNGVVHAVKDRGYAVGQVLSLTETELKRDEMQRHSAKAYADSSRISRYTRIAAAALAVIIIGGGVTAYAAPVSTVTIADGEETVEYKLNLFDRVVGVKAADDAGDELKAEVHEISGQVRGMKITDAMDVTAEKLDAKRVITEESTAVERPEISVSVSGLRQRNASLNEQLDHKVMEIHERRQAEWPERPANTDDSAPHGDNMENVTDTHEVTERAMPKDDTTDDSVDDTLPAINDTHEPSAPPADDGGRRGDQIPDRTDDIGVPEGQSGQDIEPGAPGNENDTYTDTQRTDISNDMQRPDMPQPQDQVMPDMSGDHGVPDMARREGGPGLRG